MRENSLVSCCKGGSILKGDMALSDYTRLLREFRHLTSKRPDRYDLVDGFCHILEESGFFNNVWAVFTDRTGHPVEPYFHAGMGRRFQPMSQYLKKGFIPHCAQSALDSEKTVVLKKRSRECNYCPLEHVYESGSVLSRRLGNRSASKGWICATIMTGAEDEQLPLFRELVGLLVMTLDERSGDLPGLSYRETLLMSFLEDSGNALIEIDNRRHLSAVNKGALSLLGDQLNNYLGRPVEELIDTGQYGRFQQACFRVQNSLHPEELSISLKDWEGDLYRVSLELHPNRNADGQSIGLYGLIKNGPGGNPVVNALKESEQRFIDLFAKTSAGYQSLDEEGYFLEVNQQWLDLLGYRKEEVVGHWFGEFLAPSFRDAFRERFPIFKERGKIHSEFQMLRKDGEIRFIAFEGRIGYKEDGSFKQTHCLLSDITEQRESDRILRKNQEYFKCLFTLLNSGIAILEPLPECQDFIIRNMNPSGELIYQLSLVDIQGRLFSEVLPAMEAIGILDLIRKCCQTGRSQYLPLTEYSDGRISIHMECYVARLPSSEIMLIFDDRTAQVQMEKRIRESEKMEAIGHLAGGIAHDFNNILTGIIGYTELIGLKEDKDWEIRDYLDRIESAGSRAKKLVQQILSFSRQDLERREFFLLKPLLQEHLDFLRSVIPATVVIDADLADHVPPIEGDPSGIRDILLNLSSNASTAMNDRGTLRIALSLESFSRPFDGVTGRSSAGDYAVITVQDDGCGMSRDVSDHIFEPYFTTHDVGEGSGMGLPMVFGIIKNHKANIRVSSSPGEGSVFKLFFPLLEAGDKEAVIKEKPAEGRSEFILVVDDEQMNCTLYEGLLERLGYRVKSYLDSREALNWLLSKEESVDLVITDQTMPEMTGTEFSRQIRNELPELPVLICSGFSPEVNENNYAVFGASGYLGKPFEFTDLADQIRTLLD